MKAKKINQVSDKDIVACVKRHKDNGGDLDDVIMELFDVQPDTEEYSKIKQGLSTHLSGLRKKFGAHLMATKKTAEMTEAEIAALQAEVDAKVYEKIPQFRGRPEKDMSELFALLSADDE